MSTCCQVSVLYQNTWNLKTNLEVLQDALKSAYLRNSLKTVNPSSWIQNSFLKFECLLEEHRRDLPKLSGVTPLFKIIRFPMECWKVVWNLSINPFLWKHVGSLFAPFPFQLSRLKGDTVLCALNSCPTLSNYITKWDERHQRICMNILINHIWTMLLQLCWNGHSCFHFQGP